MVRAHDFTVQSSAKRQKYKRTGLFGASSSFFVRKKPARRIKLAQGVVRRRPPQFPYIVYSIDKKIQCSYNIISIIKPTCFVRAALRRCSIFFAFLPLRGNRHGCTKRARRPNRNPENTKTPVNKGLTRVKNGRLVGLEPTSAGATIQCVNQPKTRINTQKIKCTNNCTKNSPKGANDTKNSRFSSKSVQKRVQNT